MNRDQLRITKRLELIYDAQLGKLLEGSGVSPAMVKLALITVGFYDGLDGCYAGLDRLAWDMNANERTIRRALNAAEAAGLVEITRRNTAGRGGARTSLVRVDYELLAEWACPFHVEPPAEPESGPEATGADAGAAAAEPEGTQTPDSPSPQAGSPGVAGRIGPENGDAHAKRTLSAPNAPAKRPLSAPNAPAAHELDPDPEIAALELEAAAKAAVRPGDTPGLTNRPDTALDRATRPGGTGRVARASLSLEQGALNKGKPDAAGVAGVGRVDARGRPVPIDPQVSASLELARNHRADQGAAADLLAELEPAGREQLRQRAIAEIRAVAGDLIADRLLDELEPGPALRAQMLITYRELGADGRRQLLENP